MIESPLLEKLNGYIGGRWTDNAQGNTFDVYNPATGYSLMSLQLMWRRRIAPWLLSNHCHTPF